MIHLGHQRPNLSNLRSSDFAWNSDSEKSAFLKELIEFTITKGSNTPLRERIALDANYPAWRVEISKLKFI